MGDHPDVRRNAREGGDRWGEAMMIGLLGLIAMWRGQTRAAVELSTEALQCFRGMGDRWGILQAQGPLARGLDKLATVT